MATGLFDKVLHKNKSTRTPQDLVPKACQALEKLQEGSPQKLFDDNTNLLASLKAVLLADNQSDQLRDYAITVGYEGCKMDLPLLLASKLGLLEFEAKKDAAQIFGFLVRLDNGGDKPGVRFVQQNPDMLDMLFKGYDFPEIALSCGSMLRDCVKDESLAKLVLEGPLFQHYFEKVEVSNFEVASDAFSTFKDLLTRHRLMVAGYLSKTYDQFFASYTSLLKSSNYVTRRQSLKLLGELLLERSNLKVMVRYVADEANLKLMMNLLRDSSRSIQFEAFHVFKVFVANPNKTRPIIDILVGNRDKLLKYLTDFHSDKEDEQFREEKAVIIKEISMLEGPPSEGQPADSSRHVW
ncbi:hypothetical protein ABBQ32_008447 [Trebouxia sp. C0010 RCD-2024]